jgi:hypothetical protein
MAKFTWELITFDEKRKNLKVLGTFSTKKQAERYIIENIKNFSKYGIALKQITYLSSNFSLLEDAWNYEYREDQIVYRRNHHDLF